MGQQVRSVAAEEKYNRAWLLGLILGPLLLGLMAAGWILSVADRLPAELASHWNSKNEVDGWISVAGAAWLAVAMGALGALLAPLALLSRAQSPLFARIGVGFAVTFGAAMVTFTAATVAGQIDLLDTTQAELSGPVMAAGLAAAFALGTAVLFLYKPGVVDRSQSPQVQAANAANEMAKKDGSAAALAEQLRAEQGGTLYVRVSMGWWAAVMSVVIGGIVALSTYFIFSWLALLGLVVGGFVWVFSRGTLVIAPDGIAVLASGFWKVMPLKWQEIHTATVMDIKAMDYGGWGYRMGAGSVGFIMGNGPAVVMDVGFHQKYVVSMPDAQTARKAAALINAYAQGAGVKK